MKGRYYSVTRTVFEAYHVLFRKKPNALKSSGLVSRQKGGYLCLGSCACKRGVLGFPQRFPISFRVRRTNTYLHLCIAYQFPWLSDSATHESHFDVVRAICQIFRDNVEAVASDLGVPLCLVGELDDMGAALMMAPDGIVYTCLDMPEVQIVGLSGVEAVENILIHGPLTPVSMKASLEFNEADI